MKNVDTLFIDIDNTLLDFDKFTKDAFLEGFKRYNLGDFNNHVYEVFEKENTKLWKELEQGKLTFLELKRIRFQKVFDALGIKFDGITFEHFFRDYIYDYAEPVDGAIDLLETLSKKYRLCAASNGPYEQQVHRLKVGNMSKYFSYIFISEDVGSQKPSVDFFNEAFRRMGGVDVNKCAIIGDSLTSDMQGGINIGMKTIYFNKHLKDNDTNTKPNYSFNSLREITDFLK